MRDELIGKIRAAQAELESLGVHREYFNLRRLRDEDLQEILKSLDEQLKARKRFLGVENFEQT